MKKQLSLFVATLATLFITLTASAQGEWKWAHYWTGGDGSYGDYYNKIINTAFDDEGNIYVYGTMGGSPKYDENTLQFTTSAQVLNSNKKSILLAKFDTLGNMLWYKVVKNSGSYCTPLWMEVRNNRVFISGNVEMEYVDYNWGNVWLYYLDTLIRGAQVHAIPVENRRPPYQTGRWTFFAILDTDGDVSDQHFVEAYSRERYLQGNEEVRSVSPLCQSGEETNLVHWDINGNYYVYSPIQYSGVETDSLTIIVDGDSNKIYNLFLPGNVSPNSYNNACINNAILYKFSPSGDLIFHKPLVDHTDGIASSYQFTGDSINRYFYCRYSGLSFDEEDNMYITGRMELAENTVSGGGLLHQYPVHYWWDSIHYLTANDISSAYACNFIVKYNTDGDVVWSNQVYTRVQNPENFVTVGFNRSQVNSNAVYVCGEAKNTPNTDSNIYFEQDEENTIGRSSIEQERRAFYAMFDKTTGTYIKNDFIPNETESSLANAGSASPAIVNNQLVMLATTGKTSKQIGLARWCIDGSFIDFAPAVSYPVSYCGTGPTIINNSGNVVCTIQMIGNMAFTNNVVVNGSPATSNAVLALYHNPEFTLPFVPDDSVGIDEYYQNREREIYLYPNPTDGRTTVCGYMYGYRSIELLDLQGRKLATLLDSPHGTDVPEIDLSPYPSGTYLVKINFERGVSVVRKVVRM